MEKDTQVYIFSHCYSIFTTNENMEVLSLSVISDSVTPRTVAGQAPVHGVLQARILECSHSLLQGIFPTQGLNLGLLHCRPIIYHLSHKLSPVRKHFLISVIADKQSKKSRTHSLNMAEILLKVE